MIVVESWRRKASVFSLNNSGPATSWTLSKPTFTYDDDDDDDDDDDEVIFDILPSISQCIRANIARIF